MRAHAMAVLVAGVMLSAILPGVARAESDPARPPAGELETSPSGKVVTAFAVRGDLDVTEARSNTFVLEWPKGSGRMREFPEIDRISWFPVAQARTKLLKGQRAFLDLLMAHPMVVGLSEGT